MIDETALVTGARRDGDQLVVTVDRVIFLTGDAATAANGGVPPADDHLIVNDNPLLRTYPVAADATLTGVDQLGSDDSATSAEPITAQQFLDRVDRVVARGGRPLVDLHHRSASDATVTEIHERYVP